MIAKKMVTFCAVLGYLCIVTRLGLAMPAIRPSNTDVDVVINGCSTLVLEALINRNPAISNDFRFDMRNEAKEDELFRYLSGQINQVSDRYITRTYLDTGKDSIKQLAQKSELVQDYSKAFQRCLESFTENPEIAGEIYDDDGVMSRLQNSQMQSSSFGDILKTDAVESPTKRGKALALNPTGWRKRRSDPDQNGRLQQFMHNMHELLEKRQKLQFNPTGW